MRFPLNFTDAPGTWNPEDVEFQALRKLAEARLATLEGYGEERIFGALGLQEALGNLWGSATKDPVPTEMKSKDIFH